MRSTNDAFVNGKGTIAVGTAAAAGAAPTLQLDRSVAPPKSSGMSHVTVTMSLPGVDVAATERGGPGGDGSIDGVGVGDTLQGGECHTSNIQKTKERAETRANKKSERSYSEQYGSSYTWKHSE
jgi:hypothetical protein